MIRVMLFICRESRATLNSSRFCWGVARFQCRLAGHDLPDLPGSRPGSRMGTMSGLTAGYRWYRQAGEVASTLRQRIARGDDGKAGRQ